MSIISISSNNDNVTVTSSGNNNQIGVSELNNVNNFVTTAISDGSVAVVSSNGIQNNLTLIAGSTGILNVAIEPSTTNSVLSINQGQQGPPGASGINGIVAVLNYGDNRLITASNVDTQVNAESNLLFNGTTLTVAGSAVSLTGHTHLSSDITNFNTSVDNRITIAFSGLSDISNKCDTSKILIKDNLNATKTISLSNFIDLVYEIDGGGVIFSGCP